MAPRGLFMLTVMVTYLSRMSATEDHIELIGGAIKVPLDYNKNLHPPGNPSKVEIGFIVDDILEVNDEDYTISIKMEMPMYWNDSRIFINESVIHGERALKGKDGWYYIDPDWKENLWFPTLIIGNMQEFATITSIKSNEKFMITNIPDQRFYYIAVHLIKFTCPLRFDAFPFDKHACFVETYLEMPDTEIRLDFYYGSHELWGWANLTTILNYDIEFSALPEEKLRRPEKFFTGFHFNQTVAGFQVHLRRKVSVYVFNYFIPSGLFVVVSWVSLIIPPDAIPGRIALIITTFLVLVNIANTVFSSSPTADSVNPIQVWILACIVFVFITVLEYTYILFMMRRVKQRSLSNSNKAKTKTKAKKSVAPAPVTAAPSPPAVQVELTDKMSRKQSSISIHRHDESPNPSAGHIVEAGIVMDMPKENGYANGFLKKLSCGGLEELHLENNSTPYALRASGRSRVAPEREEKPALWTQVRQHFIQYRLEFSERVSPGWGKLIERVNYVPDEIALQILMANIDYTCVWVLIGLFLVFNAAYWNWNWE